MNAQAVATVVDPPIRFYTTEAEVWRRPPRFSTYDWACRQLRMASGPLKGKLWDPKRTPYAKGVMAAYDHPRVYQVFLMGPSQRTAKTTIAHACVLADLDRKLTPVGVGLTSEKQAKRVFEDKIHRQVAAIPSLAAKLHPDPRRALQKDQILFRDGTAIYAMWAGSGPSWSSVSMEKVIIDEEDDNDDKLAVEGMKERPDAYEDLGNPKIVRVSKVRGGKDDSTIFNDAERQAHAWFVQQARCPGCRQYQTMEHKGIKSVEPDNHDPRDIRERKLARYECEHCGYQWSDEARNLALILGRWYDTRLDMDLDEWLRDVAGNAGGRLSVAFQIRSWETPSCSLSTVLADWFEAFGASPDPVKQKNFDNNHCCKPHKAIVREAKRDTVRKLIDEEHEPQTCPAEAIALTCGIDVQQLGFWFLVLAWERTARPWVVDYGWLNTWDDVSALVFDTTYPVAGMDGVVAPIWRTAIDIGGTKQKDKDGQEWSKTAEVKAWLDENALRGAVHGVKGSAKSMEVPVRATTWGNDPKTPNKFQVGTGKIVGYMVDGDKMLDRLHFALSPLTFEGKPNPVALHLPREEKAGELDPFLRQLTAEHLVRVGNKLVWSAKGRANHYSDCAKYAYACADPFWSPSMRTLAQAHFIYPEAPTKPTNHKPSRLSGLRRSPYAR